MNLRLLVLIFGLTLPLGAAAQEPAEAPKTEAPTPEAATMAQEAPKAEEAETKAPDDVEPRWDYGGDESWIINYRLPRHVFEIQLSAGGSVGIDEVPVHAEKTGGSDFGLAMSAQVAWRLDYVFSPYVDITYAHLMTTETTADTSIGKLKTEATLTTLQLMGGILFDIWYVRARFGVGFNRMNMSAKVDGAEVTNSDWDFGYMTGIGGVFYRDHGFQIGLETRVFLDPALETGYGSAGLFGTYDLFGLD